MTNVDYAANAAMAKDILSAGSPDAPEPMPPEAPVEHEPAAAPPAEQAPEPQGHTPQVPISPDFFTSARPKKWFRRSK